MTRYPDQDLADNRRSVRRRSRRKNNRLVALACEALAAGLGSWPLPHID